MAKLLKTPITVNPLTRFHQATKFGTKNKYGCKGLVKIQDFCLGLVQSELFYRKMGWQHHSAMIDVKAAITIRKKMKEKLTDKIEDHWEALINGIGKGIVIQLISEDLDPVTGSGKSVETSVRDWAPKQLEHSSYLEYVANFVEFYLVEIVVHGFSDGPIFFSANSWIQSRNDNSQSRIVFRNQVTTKYYAHLLSVRGNGKGRENIQTEFMIMLLIMTWVIQIRMMILLDPYSESRIEKPHPVYVPRDETFEEIKQATFSAGRLKAVLHNLIPSLSATLSSSDNPFTCFSEIDKLYSDGVPVNCDQETKSIFDNLLLPMMMNKALSAGQKLFKYDIPAIISGDRFSWLRDNEFARQTLAGVNPVNIEALKEFPILSKLDPAVYGPPESLLTKELIEGQLGGMTIEEAIESKSLFMLDYHDMLLPFIKKMNSLPGEKLMLLEVRVYIHKHDATTYWIWKLAKAHVCSNDAGVHQLVNHCLDIIAAHRQLSSVHPIYKLLHPHMRYTLEINALARQSLINGGGIIEACFSPGKYSMELSSAAYKNMWRFDMEGLPADLIRRGMAEEDPSLPGGVKLVIEDYPYASDGLLIWSAIEEWVDAYVNHFYSDNHSISSDNKGHSDKRNEPWWPKLKTKEDLSGILTTMIWVASGQHAALNFGQYPWRIYAKSSYPNEEITSSFLSSIPTQLQATKVMAVQDTLSTHSPDEEYLGQIHLLHCHWINDTEILRLFQKFSTRLEEIEEIIKARNCDASLKNRNGAGVPPYELLLPLSEPGVTGRGVPNSISI
ncbi:hypothetical protein MKW92_044949 [Papaver armeniacum]|nr:hypothetical protein MKW92_044949 [Papaver armeniacum]